MNKLPGFKRTIVVGLVAAGIAVTPVASPVQGASGANGSRIAFEGDGFSPWGLSVMNPDGSGMSSMGPVGAADASWSPDGKRVLFDADPSFDGNIDVFVMNADGTDVRQLTDSPAPDYWPDWFPNGKQIAFTSMRNGVPNIYVMNADGSDVRALTDALDEASVQPDVSHDGRHILFQRESPFAPPAIWVMDADGSNAHPLTPPGPGVNIDAQWSPDARSIVFSSNRGGTFEIHVMDADGGNVVQLTSSAGGDFNPTFSPDGRQIAWWKSRFGSGDIWTMDRDGGNQVNVTNSPVFEGFPDWRQGHLVQ